jgi:hypothetical protein
MSTETSGISASEQQIQTAITNQKYQNSRYDWIQKRAELAPGPGCSPGYTVACELVGAPADPIPTAAPKTAPPAKSTDVCETSSTANPVNAPSATTPVNATSAEQKPLTTADLLKALDNYTAALAAVTKAQDRADFDTAAGKLSAAVGGLAQAAGPYGAAAAPIAKASINVALWVVGEALDNQRLEELRIATHAACEPVHVVTAALGLLLDNDRQHLLGLDDEWVKDMIKEYKTDRTNRHVSDQTLGTDIDNAQAAVTALEAVRVSNPTATMQALSDAHDALVVAVRNNDGQFGALVTNLQTLAQDAQALAAAVAPPAKKS